MPVLPSEYLASWYVLADGGDLGTHYLFESWTEEENQDAEEDRLILGDIGVRNMNVGGFHFAHRISSPVLVDDGGASLAGVADARVRSVFGLLAQSFAAVQNPLTNASPPAYLLSGATIKITPQKVLVGLDFVSDVPGAFVPIFNPAADDACYRTANFLDTRLAIHTDVGGFVFQIQDADIGFKVDIERKYFVGQNGQPLFAVQGYAVDARVSMLVRPSEYDALRGYLLPLQSPGQLVGLVKNTAGTTPDQVVLSIGNGANSESVGFGKLSVGTKLSRTMAPRGLSLATLSFKAYVNSTSGLVHQNLRP